MDDWYCKQWSVDSLHTCRNGKATAPFGARTELARINASTCECRTPAMVSRHAPSCTRERERVRD